MPWKEKTVKVSRTEFVAKALLGEQSISELCRKYEISRRTGYKWIERARAGEPLDDRSRQPHGSPNKTPREVEELIVSTRIDHPAWGARKLKRYLENRGYTGLPAQSTICTILKRNNMVALEESVAHTPYKRFEKERPNDMWQVDFKGDFALLDATRCFPLTILDDHSRYSLCLEAMENQRGEHVFRQLRHIFDEYGLPQSILSDNGPPWGQGFASLTQFDVWMMQLDILPIHGRLMHPQTQGKEERFHRTLKEEVLKRELFGDIAAIQRRFNDWRYEYNYERPHHALALHTPSTRYRPSKRHYPEKLCEPEYDQGLNIRKVNYKGYLSVRSHRYFVSDSMIGKYLRVEYANDREAVLHYGNFEVGRLDLAEQALISRKIYRRNAPK